MAYGAFTLVVLAMITVVSVKAGWWDATNGQQAPVWTWLERFGVAVSIVSGVIGCLSWRFSRETAAGEGPGQEGAGTALLEPVHTAPPTGDILDRQTDRVELRKKLRDGSSGVVVVSGPPGIGKSKLVSVVLADLKPEMAGEHPLRIHLHEAAPGIRLDVKALIDDLEQRTGVTAGIRFGESSLARFTVALEALGNTRVVIVIDCAENLLDRYRKELVDFDLDEAFEILATSEHHRVSVVLITQVPPGSPGGRTWPGLADSFAVRGLPSELFARYLKELDRNNVLRLDNDPHAVRMFDEKLQGNLRHAELVYAILTRRGVLARRLAEDLAKVMHKDVPQYLTDRLIEALDQPQRRVLEALAAFATRVDVVAVATVLSEESSEEWSEDAVSGALQALEASHIARRDGEGRYYLPPSACDWVQKHGKAWDNLLFFASDVLWRRRKPNPHVIEDLDQHFAALDALLRARLHGPAYEMIYSIDKVLRDWNCGFLLLDQREAVRRTIGDEHDEMANENALGDLYAGRGEFVKAKEAYEKALGYAVTRNDVRNGSRIRANVAAMYWQQNQVTDAYVNYGLLLEQALQDGDLRIQLGALEGLADCNRRWGRYDEAVDCASQALSIPRLSEYPHSGHAQADGSARSVKIALKLARWHFELGQHADATRLLEVAREETSDRGSDSLRAAYLDGYADLLLSQRDFRKAIDSATEAEELAIRMHDPVVLLQARTTLCVANLTVGNYDEATRNIEAAARYRRQRGRSLIVVALRALLARHQQDAYKAAKFFEQLRTEATDRLQRDEHDFAAWELKGFAICGDLLDGNADLSPAIEAFRKARSIPTRPTPGLVHRMISLLQDLDNTHRRPGRLRSVIEVASLDARTPTDRA